MTNDSIDDNESRLTALARVAANQERLKDHMVELVKVASATRQMLEEERDASQRQFRPVEPVRLPIRGTHRPAGAGGSVTGAALALSDLNEGYGGAGPVGLVPGYFNELIF